MFYNVWKSQRQTQTQRLHSSPNNHSKLGSKVSFSVIFPFLLHQPLTYTHGNPLYCCCGMDERKWLCILSHLLPAIIWQLQLYGHQKKEFDILPHFQALDLSQLSGGREGNTNLDTGNMFRVFIFALCLPLTCFSIHVVLLELETWTKTLWGKRCSVCPSY